jgi:hypothetical protein
LWELFCYAKPKKKKTGGRDGQVSLFHTPTSINEGENKTKNKNSWSPWKGWRPTDMREDEKENPIDDVEKYKEL